MKKATGGRQIYLCREIASKTRWITFRMEGLLLSVGEFHSQSFKTTVTTSLVYGINNGSGIEGSVCKALHVTKQDRSAVYVLCLCWFPLQNPGAKITKTFQLKRFCFYSNGMKMYSYRRTWHHYCVLLLLISTRHTWAKPKWSNVILKFKWQLGSAYTQPIHFKPMMDYLTRHILNDANHYCWSCWHNACQLVLSKDIF